MSTVVEEGRNLMTMELCDKDTGPEMRLPFPDELLERIFMCCDGATIGRAHAVCRRWNDILASLSSRTNLWFERCRAEIPLFALMQMCGHPIESRFRAGVEWKDIYVKWRLFQGRRLWQRAANMAVMREFEWCHVDDQSYRNVLVTDDVVFRFEGRELDAFDVHSNACISKPQSHVTHTSVVLDITALGITAPVDEEGKTRFEVAVDRSVLAVLRTQQLEVYMGLTYLLSIPLSDESVRPMCSWYDTILVQVYHAGDLCVQAHKLRPLEAAGSKSFILERVQSLPMKWDAVITGVMLTGNKACIVEAKGLTVWDIPTGVNLHKFTAAVYMGEACSWCGNIIAVTSLQTGVAYKIVLFWLDNGLDRLQCIGCICPCFLPQAMRQMYDGSLLLVCGEQLDLIVMDRTKERAGRQLRDGEEWQKAGVDMGENGAAGQRNSELVRSRETEEVVECHGCHVNDRDWLEEREMDRKTNKLTAVDDKDEDQSSPKCLCTGAPKDKAEVEHRDCCSGEPSIDRREGKDGNCDGEEIVNPSEATSYRKTMSELLGITETDPLWSNYTHECELAWKDGDEDHHSCTSNTTDDNSTGANLEYLSDDCETQVPIHCAGCYGDSPHLENHCLASRTKVSYQRKPILCPPTMVGMSWQYVFTNSLVATVRCEAHVQDIRVYRWSCPSDSIS